MNKKYALVSVVLIALMSLSLFPAAFAFHTPSSTDDSAFEQYGPRPGQVLVKIYTDYASELLGFKNQEVDLMDWGLEPVDYNYFESTDPTHATYSTAFYAEYGLFEYDINNQVLPTSIISFRQALSHIIDKDYFLNTYMAGAAIKADSPNAALAAGGWHNPYTDDLYNLQPRSTLTPLPDDPADWEAAYDLLVADLGPPVPDPEDPAYYTWLWPSPFTTDPVVPDNHLLLWARSEMVPRTEQGNHMKNLLEVVMPAMLVSLGKPAARIHVDLYIAARQVTSPKVMGEYYYHLYTGGWSLGRDPDNLTLWTTAQISKPAGYGNNYLMYSNPAFDLEFDLMVTSDQPGDPLTPSDGKYHGWLAEQIIMDDAGLIPMWTFSGYKAYLSNWRGVVNQDGFGTDTWWTFLNAHKVGSEGDDILRYGFAGDIVTMNVISSQWLWDWNILGKIYDGLIAVNPYVTSQDLPYLAKGWEIDTWDNGGSPATKVTFHLREDVWWQDIPLKDRSAVSLDGSNRMDGPFVNYPFTPIDVAFSIIQIRNLVASWNGWLVGPVTHTVVNLDIWRSIWPYETEHPDWWDLDAPYVDPLLQDPTPWQYDFVQHDANLKRNDIEVYFGVYMPWLALHWVGAIPIVPFHMMKHMFLYGDGVHPSVADVNFYTEDLAYGTGPWILLDRQPTISMTLIPFEVGQSYRGITLGNSFFYDNLVVDMDSYAYDTINGLVAWKKITVTNIAPFADSFMWYWDFAIAKATWVVDHWEYTTFAGVWSVEIIGDLNGPVAIGPYETLTFYIKITPNLPTSPSLLFCEAVAIHDSIHLVHFGGPFAGKTVSWVEASWFGFGDWDGYWSYIMCYHPGDFAGGIFDPAHGGRLYTDGIVSIKDVSALAAHWQHKIPPLGDSHPGMSYNLDANDASGVCRRADLNGDLIVDIKDVSIIGLNWQKTWTTYIEW